MGTAATAECILILSVEERGCMYDLMIPWRRNGRKGSRTVYTSLGGSLALSKLREACMAFGSYSGYDTILRFGFLIFSPRGVSGH